MISSFTDQMVSISSTSRIQTLLIFFNKQFIILYLYDIIVKKKEFYQAFYKNYKKLFIIWIEEAQDNVDTVLVWNKNSWCRHQYRSVEDRGQCGKKIQKKRLVFTFLRRFISENLRKQWEIVCKKQRFLVFFSRIT